MITFALLTLLPPPSLLPAPSPALPQETAAAAPEAQDTVHLLTMSFGDLSQFIRHPKDAGLARAFGMLDERIAELPSDLGDEIPPPLLPALDAGAIPTWLRILQAPKTVSIDLSRSAMQANQMPLVIGFALHETSPEAAQQLDSEFKSLVQLMGLPIPDGMIYLQDESLVLGLGPEPGPMGETQAAKMLGGSTPLFAEMEMDLGGYFGFIEELMMQSGAPDEMGMLFDVIDRMGLMDCTIEVASTGDAEVTTTLSRMTNIGGKMRDAGLLPEAGLTANDLAPVPADATWLSVEKFDMAAGFDALNGLVTEIMQEMGEGGDAAEMLASVTGVDLRTGLFGALGDTCGMYASDTTGGGGMASTVMYFSLRDAEALIETKEQVEELINGQIAMLAQGYVSVRTWTRGDGEYTTLTFPGLPVPLEPTMAMTDDWLVIAATPQAALAAMGQINSGEGGLATHPLIAPLVASGSKSAITYFDTEHYAKSGYGTAGMMLSGLSNAVRSRTDATRDPGPILPLYTEFAAGIRPTVGYGELRGDDYINVSVTDASTVVQMAAMMGFLHENAIVFAVPALAALWGTYVQSEQIYSDF